MSTDAFINAQKFQPNVVIIKLGTNDSKPENWKYKDEFEWGGVFAMNPGKVYLTDAEYAEMADKIKAALK